MPPIYRWLPILAVLTLVSGQRATAQPTVSAAAFGTSGAMTLPDGFIREQFTVGLGGEDFAFRDDGTLWVSSGADLVTRIAFDQTTELPIRGATVEPAIVGLTEAFGVIFGPDGSLYIPEFQTGNISKTSVGVSGGRSGTIPMPRRTEGKAKPKLESTSSVATGTGKGPGSNAKAKITTRAKS